MKRRSELRALLIAVAVCILGVAVIVPFAHTGNPSSASGSQGSAADSIDTTPVADPDPSDTTDTGAAAVTTVFGKPGAKPVTTAAANQVDSAGDAVGSETSCVLSERVIRRGNSGANVICLQNALKAAGYYSGPISGKYDQATVNAVRNLQVKKDFFVDGITGRETALELGIWPDEKSLVVHTPKPAAGAKDLLGYPLSSVASTGASAPPLPENSGTGRRLVYSRAGQRVWAVDDQGRIIRSWLVSGAKYGNEAPGTHHVYSKSKVTTAWNGKAFLYLMVRWQKTKIGNIGFHQIPIHRANMKAYQTEDQLGQRLSGGCQRQAPLDAKFTWDFATIGTKVVVL